MEDLPMKAILTVVSLGISAWTFMRWKKKRNLWLLLAMIIFILSAPAFWLGFANGIYLAILAVALLLLGLWSKRGR